MVLIISDRVEETEIEVYNWLKRKNIDCEIVSSVDFFMKNHIDFDNQKQLLSINQKGENNSPIKTIWMRRDRFSSYKHLLNNHQNIINSNIDSEADTLKEFILEKGNNNINILSSYSNKKLNKLNVLKLAQEIGIRLPAFILTNRKEKLEKFINIHKKVICKASYENLSFDEKNKAYFQYVEIIDKKTLDNIPNTFFLSFFQKYISQKYEIRAFYLNGEIFAMANILSNGLSGDIRRDGFISRRIPYKFNNIHENQIKELMNRLNLTIGALDFILDDEDNLYFLEVNPNGNFLVVSKKCNYNLEEKVANYLANE